jgi:hypothetical protein
VVVEADMVDMPCAVARDMAETEETEIILPEVDINQLFLEEELVYLVLGQHHLLVVEAGTQVIQMEMMVLMEEVVGDIYLQQPLIQHIHLQEVEEV